MSSDGRGARPEGAFSIVQRVRFGDLDAMQHMNNVEFLRFFETARIDYIRSLAPGHVPTARQQFGFIFAECWIGYRSPAFFDEEIRTYVWPSELRRSSVRLQFEMRSESDERLIAEGYGVLVGYDYAQGNARPIPDELRRKLQRDPVL
ncbi:MAG: acyl-CoA thioesterase [Thermoleophilaceae bacterium]|nr:acyl-CoA thioesterase [Thermoleophilaceae bacterium]